MKTSVIICTHNPRPDYLRRVLGALEAQTLPRHQWEFVLVDNASPQPLRNQWDLSWHPDARHVREEQLGLTAARMRGIHESTGDLLVFVDDDNLLAQDYLERALEISRRWPQLGAWGCRYIPEFEVTPEEWTKRYWPLLCVGTLEADRWSNRPDSDCTPAGAGLCVRRAVALAYVNRITNDPVRKSLDRTGDSLVSGGDTDLALTACDEGLGVGMFTTLQLTHLIPKFRLTKQYLLKLAEDMAYSATILRWVRGDRDFRETGLRQGAALARALFAPRRERAFRFASLRGKARALRVVRSQRQN